MEKEEKTQESTRKDNYVLIDILKFICAIFVVGIHSHIMSDVDNDVQWYIMHMFFRIAVPFFFIASGFLFGKKVLKNKKGLKDITTKQIKRLIIPFIFWLLVSLPYVIMTTTGDNVIVVILKIVRKAIFYPWGALWFILALIVAIIMEYYFLKNGKLKNAIFLSIILYIIALLGNSYYFILEGTPFKWLMDAYRTICVTTRNGIFEAFPIFTIGVYMATKENLIEKIKNSKLIFLFIFMILVQIFEVTFIRNCNYIDDHSLFITTIIIAPIILMFCIKYKNIKLKHINNKILRNLSTGIYFMHAPIINYMSSIIPQLDNWAIFLITIFLTQIICLVAYKINNKYINYIIK